MLAEGHDLDVERGFLEFQQAFQVQARSQHHVLDQVQQHADVSVSAVGVTLEFGQVQAVAQRTQLVGVQARVELLGKAQRAEALGFRCHPGAEVAIVEWDVVSDQDGVVEEEWVVLHLHVLFDGRLVLHLFVGDVVHGGGTGRDGHLRVDQALVLVQDIEITVDLDEGQLDDPVFRANAGRLDVGDEIGPHVGSPCCCWFMRWSGQKPARDSFFRRGGLPGLSS